VRFDIYFSAPHAIDWSRRILAHTCMLFASRCANLRAQRKKDETGNDLRILPASYGLCCTLQVWRRDTRSGWAMTAPYASPAIRDEFLAALDTDDRTLSTRLAVNLTGCSNPLPGMTCNMLGLPTGSTYGSAASRVLQLYSLPR